MAVQDHGLEVLKKSGEQVTPGDPSDYYIKVANKDGSIIGSGGGGSGTEYTEGATDASITGVAAMAEGPSNTLATLKVDAVGALQVKTIAGSAGSLQLSSGAYNALSVTTTPVIAKAGGSNLTNRVILTFTPLDGDVYIGFDNSVTSSTGFPIEQGSVANIAATATLNVYLVTAAGTVNVRLIEGADS